MVFQCINIRQVPWEVLKTAVPRDLANVNAWKTMFDLYIESRQEVREVVSIINNARQSTNCTNSLQEEQLHVKCQALFPWKTIECRLLLLLMLKGWFSKYKKHITSVTCSDVLYNVSWMFPYSWSHSMQECRVIPWSYNIHSTWYTRSSY